MRLRFCPPVNDTGAAAIGLLLEEAPSRGENRSRLTAASISMAMNSRRSRFY